MHVLHARTAECRVALGFHFCRFPLPLASHLCAPKAEWRHEPPQHGDGTGKISATQTHRLGYTVLEGSELLLAHVLLHFEVLCVDAGTVRCSLMGQDASAWVSAEDGI